MSEACRGFVPRVTEGMLGYSSNICVEVHRVVITLMISLNIKLKYFQKCVNNEIPGAFKRIQHDLSAHAQILQRVEGFSAENSKLHKSGYPRTDQAYPPTLFIAQNLRNSEEGFRSVKFFQQ